MRRKNQPDKWRRIRKLYHDIKEGQSTWNICDKINLQVNIIIINYNT